MDELVVCDHDWHQVNCLRLEDEPSLVAQFYKCSRCCAETERVVVMPIALAYVNGKSVVKES
jgi:hypothetical protein